MWAGSGVIRIFSLVEKLCGTSRCRSYSLGTLAAVLSLPWIHIKLFRVPGCPFNIMGRSHSMRHSGTHKVCLGLNTKQQGHLFNFWVEIHEAGFGELMLTHGCKEDVNFFVVFSPLLALLHFWNLSGCIICSAHLKLIWSASHCFHIKSWFCFCLMETNLDGMVA